MTQAFYDVLAIKPTYLGITLGPYYIEIMACRGLIFCETETTKKNADGTVYNRTVS